MTYESIHGATVTFKVIRNGAAPVESEVREAAEGN